MLRLLVTLVLLLVVAETGYAQGGKRAKASKTEKTHLLIILDCSKSMWDMWQSDAKIKITQQVLLRFIDSVATQQNIDVALRVFGHLNNEQYGTRLEVPFGQDNLYRLQSKIKTLVPNGGCDASSALDHSLNDFSQLGSERNIILIITDGLDDCSGDICQVARHVQLSGVIVQTFILGIGSKTDFAYNLECAGKFTYLPTEEQYTDALFGVLRQADESAQVVINLTNHEGEAYEASFPVAFYDSQTGVVKYSTIYSCNTKVDADTLTVDPLVKYNVTFFTKPEIRFENLTFAPNKVSNIDAKLELGSMRVRYDGQRTSYSVPQYDILIRRHGESEVMHRQHIGELVSYCAGTYDLEVLSLPTVRLQGVEVRNDGQTDLSLPTPGLLTIGKPKGIMTGSLFQLSDGRLTWVADLNPSLVNERMVLAPGDYQIVIKPQRANNFGSVRSRRFTIVSAQTTNITF